MTVKNATKPEKSDAIEEEGEGNGRKDASQQEQVNIYHLLENQKEEENKK